MTAIIGNDGDITLPSGHDQTLLDTYRVSVEQTIVEVTPFVPSSGSSVHRRHRAGGLLAVTGSASGTPDAVSGANPGAVDSQMIAGATMTLTPISGSTWIFTALMTNIGLETAKTGSARITFDFINGDADDFAESW